LDYFLALAEKAFDLVFRMFLCVLLMLLYTGRQLMGVVSTGEEVADSNSGTTKTTEPCHLLRVNVKKAGGLAMLLERSFGGALQER